MIAYGEGADQEIFKEITTPECHFLGSMFVSVYSRIFLNDYLAKSLSSTILMTSFVSLTQLQSCDCEGGVNPNTLILIDKG